MLNDQTDQELIIKVKEDNCSDALSELINRHSGICYDIYNKYFKTAQSVDAQEVKDHKNFLIFKAAQSFDETRGAKFSTWLGNTVTYACLNVCGLKSKSIQVEESTLNFLVDSKTNESFDIDNQDKETLDYIKDIISQSHDENAKKVVNIRYFSGGKKPKSFKFIADKLGVSVQTAINWHDKFIELLRNKLTTNTICDII
jgi:RNA polymerase sigma factor (sigma-70 family)